MLSAERVSEIVQSYERRLKNNKKWAKDYYVRHANDIKQKKLLAGVARGRCPSKSTIERLEVDRRLLVDAWMAYTSAQEELTGRAQLFHRYLTGEEWTQKKISAFERLKKISQPKDI
jgi:hypothetical protein